MEDILPVEIIKKIIEYMDNCPDLVSCRIINKRWNILSSELLKCKSLHPLIRFSEERLWEFFSCMESNLSDEIPFSKFHFQLDTFSTTGDIALFYQKYGKQVRELSFELREKRLTPPSLEILQLQFYMIPHTPHLTTLQLNISCSIKETDAAVLTQLLPPSSLPKLRSIKLYRDITAVKENENDGRLALLETLKNAAPYLREIEIAPWSGTQLCRVKPLQRIFKDTPRMVLSNVSFLTYHPLEEAALHNPASKLTQLDIRLNYDFDKAEQYHFNYDHIRALFCQWLEFHSDTLKTLKVVLESVSEMQIPTLRALTSLEFGLGAYDEVDMNNPLVPFQPAQFPNLRNVALNFYSEDWGLFSVENPFHTVESLKFQGYQEGFVNLRWDFIFPNLKSLELICVKGDQLKFFLRHMTMIVRLKIQLSDYMTEVIHVLDGSTRSDISEESTPDKKSSPITNITSLKTLEIVGCGPITLQKIVNMTKNGFLQPLVNLSIDVEKISKEEIDTLKSVHRNVNITRVRK